MIENEPLALGCGVLSAPRRARAAHSATVLGRAVLRRALLSGGFVLLVTLGGSGCSTQASTEASTEAQRIAFENLNQELATQRTELGQLDQRLVAIQSTQVELLEAISEQAVKSDELIDGLNDVSRNVAKVRASSAPGPEKSPGGVRTVVVQGDQMIVGSVERVWLDPPGALVTARVDSGAESSSLHADDLVEFERDGDDWVRFRVFSDDDRKQAADGTVVERRVVRRVRVIQQSNPEGDHRVVVEMRVTLGNVQGNFEFTLADRSHLDQEALLGRNFLTDVAIVDVGRTKVQKAYVPTTTKD
ncbi:MAG: hypothetical protein ACI8TX_003009 [Hyphomicrobiaceae bacterium]|jgi:hypothetical protein